MVAHHASRLRALLVAAAAATAAATSGCGTPGTPTADANAHGTGPAFEPFAGAALYERHCAGCHGASGAADTAIAPLLFPAPRAFTDGVFKLASTQNGVPTEDDLVRTLRRGMPGSAMPSYAWLPDESLRALALHVVTLCGDRLPMPGPTVRVPTPIPTNDESLAAGEELYQSWCAACHGADGTGRAPAIEWAGAREQMWPRDFTAGFLRGAPSFAELCYRVRAGMPGAHMPPTPLSDEQTALLVGYVQSLIPDGAAEHHVQWRRRLHARRVDALPAAATAAGWDAVEAVRLPTAPLWWRPEAVDEVWVRAVHDGQRAALQLSWADATRDDRAMTAAPAGDGVAVQLSAATDAPWVAMGGGETVDIWHWKAFRPGDVAGALDLLDDAVHRGLDVPPELPGVARPQLRAESIQVHGPDEIAERRGRGLDVALDPVWQDGRWTVVLGRALAPRSDDELALRPGDRVLVAFAVWDGTIDRHPGSKSVTVWHELTLDP